MASVICLTTTHTTVLQIAGTARVSRYHSHLLWSSIIPYLLHPSNTINDILHVQFTHVTVFFHNLSPQVFFGLPLGLAPSTS